MRNKTKKGLVLASIPVVVAITLVGVFGSGGFNKNFRLLATDNTQWRHYSAVAPTCSTFGIKEYWTNCNGVTVLEDPHVEATDYTTTQADIQAIIETYGESDPRIIAKSDDHSFALDTSCLGKEVCSACGEARAVIPTIDFVNNGIYGMYDWYKNFGAPDSSWVTTPSSDSIQFLTYNPGYETEISLPRIYFAGFECVTIDLKIDRVDELLYLSQDKSTTYKIPSASYDMKFVFSNIDETSMTVTLRDSSNNVLLSKNETGANVLAGTEGFKFYIESAAYSVGYNILNNFNFVKDHEHNYATDTSCIGKEVCSVCYGERGVNNPTFDFTANLFGAYDVYEAWGLYPQDGWAKADNAGQLSFANYTNGDICQYHLPRIYFKAYSSLSIDVVVNYGDVVYSFDHEFTTSYSTPFAGYSLKLVFENITSSSMDVKILDAFSTAQVQAKCTDTNVLNGFEGFTTYVKGSGNVGWDTFSNFTFVA